MDTRKRKPPKPPTVALVKPVNPETGVCMVRIAIRGKSHTYLVRKVAADYGQAFEFGKITAVVPDWNSLRFELGEVYALHLETYPEGVEASCNCKGYLYVGHCKHVYSLYALLADGALDSMEVRQ